MTIKGDNKIGIPWYKRTPGGIGELSDMGNNPVSFNLPNIRPRTRPRAQEPVRQPVRQPALQPSTQFSLNPATQPGFQNGVQPDFQPGFPVPVPLPGRKPDTNPDPAKPLFPNLPGVPMVPQWAKDPNYNWADHFEKNRQSIAAASASLPNPVTETKPNPMLKTVGRILAPVALIMGLRESANEYVKVTVTDPIYAKMLQDPVLGVALREAEKANLDAENVGTILANFDWENGDYEELQKSLAMGVGAAGAARLLVFIVGRKIVFRL